MGFEDREYDYTRDNPGAQRGGVNRGTPFDSPDDNPEEFVIGGGEEIVGVAGMKSADEYRAENFYEKVQPGKHVLQVLSIPFPPTKNLYKLMVGGRLESFETHLVKVRFALPHNHMTTMDDSFMLPPPNRADLNAYFNGVSLKAKPGAHGGQAAGRFVQFIKSIGFPWAPGTSLPRDACILKNWLHWPNGEPRLVIATVQKGTGTFEGDNGEQIPRPDSIKWYSYEPATPEAIRSLGANAVRAASGTSGREAASGKPNEMRSQAPQGAAGAANASAANAAGAPASHADQLQNTGLRNL
jgi:hypothetical protein